MEPEVLQAMADAAREFVKIDELQEAAGRVIGEITGAEDGYVTPGAAAAMALATAACITGTDPMKINQLPDTSGMKDEVVIQRAHRYDYDHAIRSVGARLIEIGFPDLTFEYELEAAIGPKTAAVAYYPIRSRPSIPLSNVVDISHRHGVPVIVDAALEVPPVENLRQFVAEGADLVAYSGGKAIGGPQASGFLAGRADLILAVALHHQDMDVRLETWTYRHRVEKGSLPGPPHHGIGRTMKVGKEEIVGLIVALQRYMGRDHERDLTIWNTRLRFIETELSRTPGLSVRVVDPSPHGTAVPFALLELNEDSLGMTAWDLLNLLQEGEPRIFLNEEQAWRGAVAVHPMSLRDGEEAMIAQRIAGALASSRSA